MLSRLRIKSFALVDEVDLDLQSGLSFFTGETGAGKSILIDAICRILGARATQEDVRAGEPKAVLEAIFLASGLTSAARDLLREWSIDLEEEELILRREIFASGKNRALINNCSITLQQLRSLAPYLVDVFGQNEHQTLLDQESQRSVFDDSIGVSGKIELLSEKASQIRGYQEEWRSLREREQQRQRNMDMLQYQIREIEEAKVSPNEEQDLLTRRALLQNAEKIHSLCEAVLENVLESDNSLEGRIDQTGKMIADLARYDSAFETFQGQLAEWKEAIHEIVHRADTLRRSLDFEEGSLDTLESRLDQLALLKKKYGPTVEDVLQHLERAKKELDLNLNAEERAEEVMKALAAEAGRYENMAGEIGTARDAARTEFERKVETELKQVAMEKCRFRVSLLRPANPLSSDLTSRQFPAHGWETVVFEIEPNPGEGFRELGRIASGGELSRLMLALKVVTQPEGEKQCLIFDEIDAGIGGRVAHQIGERLKKLSHRAQVLCVTHLPQVAAFGDQHFLVSKQGKEHRTITIVDRVEGDRRIRELARMLAGSEITETALAHARELREQVEAQ